jgi:hypothetical protein
MKLLSFLTKSKPLPVSPGGVDPEITKAVAVPITKAELEKLEARVLELQAFFGGPKDDLSDTGYLISVEMPRLIAVAKKAMP